LPGRMPRGPSNSPGKEEGGSPGGCEGEPVVSSARSAVARRGRSSHSGLGAQFREQVLRQLAESLIHSQSGSSGGTPPSPGPCPDLVPSSGSEGPSSPSRERLASRPARSLPPRLGGRWGSRSSLGFYIDAYATLEPVRTEGNAADPATRGEEGGVWCSICFTEEHSLERCPHTVRCTHCGGVHWWSECPEARCRLCRGTHWSTRCPGQAPRPRAPSPRAPTPEVEEVD